MAITLDEPTFVDNILYYGLFLGAIFQLACIAAVVFIPHSENEEVHTNKTCFVLDTARYVLCDSLRIV